RRGRFRLLSWTAQLPAPRRTEADPDRADTDAKAHAGSVVIRPRVSSVPGRCVVRPGIHADMKARRVAVAGSRRVTVAIARRHSVAGLIPGRVSVETRAAIPIVPGRYAHSGADGAFPIGHATAAIAAFNAGTSVQSALAAAEALLRNARIRAAFTAQGAL